MNVFFSIQFFFSSDSFIFIRLQNLTIFEMTFVFKLNKY